MEKSFLKLCFLVLLVLNSLGLPSFVAGARKELLFPTGQACDAGDEPCKFWCPRCPPICIHNVCWSCGVDICPPEDVPNHT
ncbi:hypothetical protein Sjap_004312 [Stephania japonica]|uniref:Uncharacterized protein n=1 Tax=Stephania japonica TaxID=461633 RepID=A0AAP0K325_9MAGN